LWDYYKKSVSRFEVLAAVPTKLNTSGFMPFQRVHRHRRVGDAKLLYNAWHPRRLESWKNTNVRRGGWHIFLAFPGVIQAGKFKYSLF